MMKKTVFQRVADFYDQNCNDFSSTRNYWWSDLDFIRKYLKKKGAILDFGCGNGRLISFLEKENFKGKYQGADISRGLIAIAQKKYPQKQFFLLGEEEKWPFADESFDLVIAIAVFHHLSPKMAKNSLREMKRILCPGGKVILTVWNLWKWPYVKFLWEDFSSKKDFLSGEIPFGKDKKQVRWCYWWTLKKLEKVLKEEGFAVLEKGVSRSKNNQKRNYWLVGEK